MGVEINISQSFSTDSQLVKVSNNSLGGVLLTITELYPDELPSSTRLYLEDDEALALSKMLLNLVNK